MAAPLLRHYSLRLSTTWTTLFTVPSGRALVISKFLVASGGAQTGANVALAIGNENIMTGVAIPANSVYTETGLVMVAGEYLQAYASQNVTYSLHVFGEEVDN